MPSSAYRKLLEALSCAGIEVDSSTTRASRTAVDLKDKWRNLLRSVQALQAGTSPTRSPNAAAPVALLRRVKALAAD